VPFGTHRCATQTLARAIDRARGHRRHPPRAARRPASTAKRPVDHGGPVEWRALETPSPQRSLPIAFVEYETADAPVLLRELV
jgi:hypothetical protein